MQMQILIPRFLSSSLLLLQNKMVTLISSSA